jgi:hypothetical protein
MLALTYKTTQCHNEAESEHFLLQKLQNLHMLLSWWLINNNAFSTACCGVGPYVWALKNLSYVRLAMANIRIRIF